MTSLLTPPLQGTDAVAAGPVPPSRDVHDVGRAGRVAELTPALPAFVCDHTGHDRDACLADHWALMERLRTYA